MLFVKNRWCFQVVNKRNVIVTPAAYCFVKANGSDRTVVFFDLGLDDVMIQNPPQGLVGGSQLLGAGGHGHGLG